MFNLFGEVDIINNLKMIITSMEENEERKQIIYAYYLETKKKAVECDCERGMSRIKCPKCKGAGYYLVEDNKGDNNVKDKR